MDLKIKGNQTKNTENKTVKDWLSQRRFQGVKDRKQLANDRKTWRGVLESVIGIQGL